MDGERSGMCVNTSLGGRVPGRSERGEGAHDGLLLFRVRASLAVAIERYNDRVREICLSLTQWEEESDLKPNEIVGHSECVRGMPLCFKVCERYERAWDLAILNADTQHSSHRLCVNH